MKKVFVSILHVCQHAQQRGVKGRSLTKNVCAPTMTRSIEGIRRPLEFGQ